MGGGHKSFLLEIPTQHLFSFVLGVFFLLLNGFYVILFLPIISLFIFQHFVHFSPFLPDCNCVCNSVHQSFGLMLSTHQYFSLLWRYVICCISNIYHRNFLHSHFMFIYSDLTKALSHTFYHLLFYHLRQSLTTFY